MLLHQHNYSSIVFTSVVLSFFSVDARLTLTFFSHGQLPRLPWTQWRAWQKGAVLRYSFATRLDGPYHDKIRANLWVFGTKICNKIIWCTLFNCYDNDTFLLSVEWNLRWWIQWWETKRIQGHDPEEVRCYNYQCSNVVHFVFTRRAIFAKLHFKIDWVKVDPQKKNSVKWIWSWRPAAQPLVVILCGIKIILLKGKE